MVQEVDTPIREIEVVAKTVVEMVVEITKTEVVEINLSVAILHNIVGCMEHVLIQAGLATILNLDMYSGQQWKTSATGRLNIVNVLDSLGAIL